MNVNRNRNLLFNWIFLVGIIILALNDHVLKWQFSNLLTGKLSDIVGLLILPMFIQFVFPRPKNYAIVVSGIFFIFWKSPLSEDFIHLYNQCTLIPITRTVDYTDLLALAVLPLSHFLINHIDNYRLGNLAIRTSPLWVLIPSCIIFMATSPPISYYKKPNGDIHIGKSYRIKSSKAAFLAKLKLEGLTVRPDTSEKQPSRADYYLIDNVVLNHGKDTVKSIQIGFVGNVLIVNNVNLKGDFKVSDWKQLKQYSKHYQKLIKTEIIEEIK